MSKLHTYFFEFSSSCIIFLIYFWPLFEEERMFVPFRILILAAVQDLRVVVLSCYFFCPLSCSKFRGKVTIPEFQRRMICLAQRSISCCSQSPRATLNEPSAPVSTRVNFTFCSGGRRQQFHLRTIRGHFPFHAPHHNIFPAFYFLEAARGFFYCVV